MQPLYVVDNALTQYDAFGYDPTDLRDAFVEEGRRLMADALVRIKHENVAGVPRIVDVAPIGEDISERICISANEFNADLLVLGTHGRRTRHAQREPSGAAGAKPASASHGRGCGRGQPGQTVPAAATHENRTDKVPKDLPGLQLHLVP